VRVNKSFQNEYHYKVGCYNYCVSVFLVVARTVSASLVSKKNLYSAKVGFFTWSTNVQMSFVYGPRSGI